MFENDSFNVEVVHAFTILAFLSRKVFWTFEKGAPGFHLFNKLWTTCRIKEMIYLQGTTRGGTLIYF